MKLIALTLALVFPLASVACDDAVIGNHLSTHHTDRSANYREDNAGEYFRCGNGFTAGSYKNSDWKRSDYVGYSVQTGPFNLAVMLVSGYQIEPIPAVIPSVKITDNIRIAYLPQAPNKQNNTTGWYISFERKM